MLRTTFALIEFCALLDEGSYPAERFPDPDGDVGAAAGFAGYLEMARLYLEIFPSSLTEEQLNVAEMLPCPN
jgi:hypothetical protein